MKAVITDDDVRAVLRGFDIVQPVLRIDDIADGMLNTVKRVTVHDGTVVVVRVRHFQHPDYGQEFAAERLAYPMLADRAVRVPRLLGVDSAGTFCGYPSAVFEFITGPLLAVSLAKTAADGRRPLLTSLARSLAEVHAVCGPAYGTLTQALFPDGEIAAFWESLVLKEQRRLRDTGAEWSGAFDRLAREWLRRLEQSPRELVRACLVHGDLHGMNIICEANGDLALIDWEACRMRYAPYDFAQIRFCNLRGHVADWDWFVAAYLEARALKSMVGEFTQLVAICETFWRLRMGLFFLQYRFGESPYFGTAEDHLAAVADASRLVAASAP